MKAFLFDSNVPLHWRGRLRLQAGGSGCLKQHNWFDGQTESVQIQYSQMNARHARKQLLVVHLSLKLILVALQTCKNALPKIPTYRIDANIKIVMKGI